MSVPDPLNAIDAILSELDQGEGIDYHKKGALYMWRLLVNHHRQPSPRPPGELPAIPYVPVDLTDLGLHLDTDDSVLDIGCQGGYGLADFWLERHGASLPCPRLVGVEYSRDHLQVARRVAPAWADDRVHFVRADGAALPFRQDSFALVVVRVVLPYVRMEPAMLSLSRVLRPGGLVLIQLHAPAYYWSRLKTDAIRPRRALYLLRAIIAGAAFRHTHRQAQCRWLAETAIDAETFRSYSRGFGLELVWEGDDRLRPMLVLRRT